MPNETLCYGTSIAEVVVVGTSRAHQKSLRTESRPGDIWLGKRRLLDVPSSSFVDTHTFKHLRKHTIQICHCYHILIYRLYLIKGPTQSQLGYLYRNGLVWFKHKRPTYALGARTFERWRIHSARSDGKSTVLGWSGFFL